MLKKAAAMGFFVLCVLGAPARAQEKKEDPPPAQQAPAREEQPSSQQSAAEPKRPAPKPPRTLDDLLRLIEEQKKLIADLQTRLDAQQKDIEKRSADLDASRKEIDALKLQIESMTRRLDELQGELPALQSQKALEERLKRVEEGTQKTPELPPDVVSAGDFPGSIRIPGTDAAIKFGGRVRVAVVATFDPLGSEDRFLTNSIPVDQVVLPGQGENTDINAIASRFNFEMRTPAGAQNMRAFIEGDFAGSGSAFRLRHAYGQYHGFLFGQTWSTFADPATDAEDLDFEGISSDNFVRQPQIRYTMKPRDDLSVAAAIETPEVSVTNGVGNDLVPDAIGRTIWTFGETGHLQGAVVIRQIRAAWVDDPEDFVSEAGWGVSMSGVFPFKVWGLTDRFIFQVNAGHGIGRYINDLNSLGGMDGAFDEATGDFEVLPVLGWYVDYEHTWKEWERTRKMDLRSSLIWSVVIVDNPGFMPDDAYRRTHRLSANLVFSPISRMDIGVEYIWGRRENKNGAAGEARQLQLVVLFRF